MLYSKSFHYIMLGNVSLNMSMYRCGENGIVMHCWWECKLVQPLRKTVWRFLKKLKIELPYDSAIPLLGGICLSEINKNTNAKRHTHSKVQSSIIYNCQGMEAT